MSPESIVSTGLSDASKKPRCTVVGDALSSWIFSSLRACVAAQTRRRPKPIFNAHERMVTSARRLKCQKSGCPGQARASQWRLLTESHRTQRKIVANDLSALHHELHPLQLADVGERIAGDGDEIGKLALLDRAGLIAPT